MKSPGHRLGIRLYPFNSLTFPVVLHTLEQAGLDRYFDFHILRNQQDVKQFLTLSSPGLLFYSFMTPHIPQINREMQWIGQRRHPRLQLIAGGPHTSGDPISSLKMGFDIAFTGAAETGLPHLIRYYLDGNLPAGKIVFRSPQIEDLDRSLPISRILPLSPPLELTRGCYWNCQFCQTACEKATHRSFESIVHYYTELQRRGHHRRVSFISPSAFEYGAAGAGHLNYKAVNRLLEYCRNGGTRHLEYGIFPSETRPNTFSEEFVLLVASLCSNRKITVGAQSGSDRLLRLLRRGHTVEHVELACEMVISHQLRPLVDIIVGFPGEKSDDRRETFIFVKKLSKRFRARIHLHYFLPLSGTALAEEMPADLDYRSLDTMEALEKGGVCTGWWRKGRDLSRELVAFRERLQNEDIEYQEMIP